MPVTVTLPNGSTTEVPSRKREIKSKQISPAGRSVFIDEPLPHPDYDFRAVIGRYLATPKQAAG